MFPAEVGDIDNDAIGIAEFLFVKRRRRVAGGPPHEVFAAGFLDRLRRSLRRGGGTSTEKNMRTCRTERLGRRTANAARSTRHDGGLSFKNSHGDLLRVRLLESEER